MRVVLLSVLLLVVGCWCASPAVADDNTLALSLQQYFSKFSSRHPAWTVGCQVTAVADRKPIYGLGAERLMTPGSVVKLATTLAALKIFGGAYRFPTEFFLDALPSAVGQPGDRRVDFSDPSLSVGNLYVRGYGDPSLESSRVLEFAETIRALGVTEVRDIVIDDSLFVDPPRPSGERPHQAGLGALSLGSNCYGAFVAPGTLGGPAAVSLTAGAPFTLTNKVRTIRGRMPSIEVRQNPPSTALPPGGRAVRELLTERDRIQVTVEGTIGDQDAGESLFFTVPDPGAYFGAVLRHYLKLSGIEVKGVVRRGETPEQARPLHTFESRELNEILADMNHASNNFYAGQISYVLGQDPLGYFRGDLGLTKIRELLVESGVADSAFELHDASGLDRDDRGSSAGIVGILLAGVSDHSIAPDFIASLSRFALSGTLKSRALLEPEYVQTLHGEALRELEHRARAVWAKTGTLDKVSSLAGVAESKDGEQLAFSVILNGEGSKEEFSKAEEEIVRLLIGAPAHYTPRQVIPGGGNRTPTAPADAGEPLGSGLPEGQGAAPGKSGNPSGGNGEPGGVSIRDSGTAGSDRGRSDFRRSGGGGE